jgi:hypothetical protein
MSESAPAIRELSLRKVIWGAFSLSWQHRVSLFRVTAFPLLALIGASLLWEFLAWNAGYLAQWAPYGIYLAAISWLAVTVHRLVLLDEASAGIHFKASSWKRVAVYVLALAAIGVMFLAVKFLLFNVIGLATGINYVPVGTVPKLAARLWLNWGSTIVALLVISRFVLVLPSVAVDRGHAFKDSWRNARGNSWRLAVVYGGLPWALGGFSWLLYRDGGSNIELALVVILGCLLAVVEIVALSLSYAALVADGQGSSRD